MTRDAPTKEATLAEYGVDEAELIGQQSDDVPQISAGRLCNAKKTENGTGVFQGYCRAFAGAGTENNDGRCKSHGGSTSGVPGNQHAQKHGMSADPRHYADNLDPEEQEWVRDMSATIEDRIRNNTGGIDPLDRTLARRLAIRLHIVAQASEYVQTNGLIETIWTNDGRQDVENRLLEELRQFDKDIVQDLKRIGVLDDPDTQKADALTEWREYIE